MRVRVLGCHGGESPKHRSTCFLVDNTLAIDAGSLASALEIRQQRRVRNIVVSHCHLDHVKDLAMLADNIVGGLKETVNVIGSPWTLRQLRVHLFNGILWPDFTKLPSRKRPVFRMVPIRPGKPLRVGKYRLRCLKVHHPVESMSFFIRGPNGKELAFSSDTGPTQELWCELNRSKRVAALLLETSFPNRMQPLATAVGHLTPRTMIEQLEKVDRKIPVWLYHLKPPYEEAVRREVKKLGRRDIAVLKLGQTLKI